MKPDLFGRTLQALDRALSLVENLTNRVAGVVVFLLMLFGVLQIVMRAVFQAPIFGYIDIVEIVMVVFAVLAIAYVQRLGGHVRMELLIARLRGRALWLAEFFGTVCAGFIVAVLIPASYSHFARAFEFGDSTIDIEIATWPAKLVVPLALAVLFIRIALQAAGYLRLAIWVDRIPLAVPIIKDPDQRAAEEISLSAVDAAEPSNGPGDARP